MAHLSSLKRSAPLAVLGLTILFSGVALAGEFERSFTLQGGGLELVNLIGEITLEQTGGSDFVVDVFVRGDDADDDLIHFDVDEGSTSRLVIEFPIEDERRYVYPELGARSNSTITVRNTGGDSGDGSLLKKIFGGLGKNRIKVSGRGNGLEVWADVVIKVPQGSRVEVLHGVGDISAKGIEADIRLDSSSGQILGMQLDGEIVADTGSGMVEMEDIKGRLNVDTGSGAVSVNGFDGDGMLVDTGSGHVEVEQITCDELEIDTGSGGVDALHVSANSVKIDTGSGGVELQLDQMGDGRFIIDTGSGGIELTLPDNASARVHADTGSGSVRTDIDGVKIRKKDRDEVTFTIGDGDARVDLDAGSGSIKIKQR